MVTPPPPLKKEPLMHRLDRSPTFLTLVVLSFVLAFVLPLTGCTTMNQQTKTCTISSKESVMVRTGENLTGNQYRVYTEECGTLTVQDSLAIARYDSADLYGQLKPDTTYTMEIGGYRVPAMSAFPNIITATPVEQ